MMELINIAELKRRIRDNKILTHAEVEYVIDCIDGQSETYDIDKVVEELEIERFRSNYEQEQVVYDKAIEIVKTGGKNE